MSRLGDIYSFALGEKGRFWRFFAHSSLPRGPIPKVSWGYM